eukprot:scaffold10084_cov139-Isochrysis_galbana.AAC.15
MSGVHMAPPVRACVQNTNQVLLSPPIFIEGREPPNIKNSQRIRHEAHFDRQAEVVHKANSLTSTDWYINSPRVEQAPSSNERGRAR